jgi:hypothetical protein
MVLDGQGLVEGIGRRPLHYTPYLGTYSKGK